MSLDELVRTCVAAGLVLIAVLAVLLVMLWVHVLGRSTHSDRQAILCAEKLDDCGFPMQSATQSARRHLGFAFKRAFVELSGQKVDSQSHNLRNQIQEIHGRAKRAESCDVLERNRSALEQLSGQMICSKPEGVIDSEVQKLLEALDEIKSAQNKSAAESVIRLSKPLGFWKWVGLLRSTEDGWTPFRPVLTTLGQLLDFVGRGTTVGVLVGLSIALLQGSTLESYASTLPLIGGITGGFAYGWVLVSALEPQHPRLSKFVYSLIIIFLVAAYVVITKLF